MLKIFFLTKMIAVHRVFGADSQNRTGDSALTKRVLYQLRYISIIGARGGVRTRDTQIKSLVLYQLSYTSIAKEVIADTNQWKLLSHSFQHGADSGTRTHTTCVSGF